MESVTFSLCILFIVFLYKLLSIMQKNVTFLLKSTCSGKRCVLQPKYHSELVATRPKSSQSEEIRYAKVHKYCGRTVIKETSEECSEFVEKALFFF